MELKRTKSRSEILELLKKQSAPITANEIFEKLMNKKITLSTIYRTLETFSKNGTIKKEIQKSGTAVYFLSPDEHCHILECKNCHNTIKLAYCPYDKANIKIKKETNFLVDEENVVIYGLCKNCNKNKKAYWNGPFFVV